jgi:Cu2+-containing amine oxidase
VDGQEVVLVSEMTAGWYRYISEWRFHADGTIRPRWGFSAIDNPCPCSTHIHHVYWRFDFDIRTSWNNIVEEFNDPPIFPNTNWHTKWYEIRRPRDPSRDRLWKVSNAATGEGYLLVPGSGDGFSDAYGIGDVWVLKYHPSEIDDGQGFTTNPALSQAHLDQFKSPAEPVANTDVVLWYAGHFRHDQAHAAGERVGPELRPVNW